MFDRRHYLLLGSYPLITSGYWGRMPSTKERITWDYTRLAPSYGGRPPYAEAVVSDMVKRAGLRAADRVCDIGAGTGHLTVELLACDLNIDAVEPNDAMREIGRDRTRGRAVAWYDATAEATGRPDASYGLVTFGSSFNVVDRPLALAEAARLLRPSGWVACVWNHRDLDDPVQAAIETIICSEVPDYDYGYRREREPPSELVGSSLFAAPDALEAGVHRVVDASEWVDAWRSHATLARQAGDLTERIIGRIASVVAQAEDNGSLVVPYVTRGWMAQAEA